MAEALRIELEQERIDPAFLFPALLTEWGQTAFVARAFQTYATSNKNR